MEYKGKKYYGDSICGMNINNKEFVSQQLAFLNDVINKDMFWVDFNGIASVLSPKGDSSIGNLLMLLYFSNVVSEEQKILINSVLEKIPKEYLNKL
jgi:hypothetical protein